jgi:chromosome partitioning protein
VVTNNEPTELLARIAAVREQAIHQLATKIIAVIGWKGGVGKTLFAMELAYLLAAILVDMDWERGNASRALGYMYERYTRRPLIEAFNNKTTPTPKNMGERRPDMVPCDPEFAANQPSPDKGSSQLIQWAQEWKRPVMLDTHPGACDATFAAIGAADLLVVPVTLGTRELDALEGLLEDLSGYPLLLVPNEVPSGGTAAEEDRLERMAREAGVPVSQAFVGEHRWLRTRKIRTVISAAGKFGTRTTEPLATEMVSVAEEVLLRVV